MTGYQQGSGRERVGKGTENKQHKWQVENRQGEVKNSVGNGEAKEIICMTHGHKVSGDEGVRDAGRKGGRYQAKGDKGEKKMGQL